MGKIPTTEVKGHQKLKRSSSSFICIKNHSQKEQLKTVDETEVTGDDQTNEW